MGAARYRRSCRTGRRAGRSPRRWSAEDGRPPCHADRRAAPMNPYAFRRICCGGGTASSSEAKAEPEFDCARWEFVATFLEWAGLGLDREQPDHPRIAQQGARVDRERGSRVTTGAARSPEQPCHEIARHAFEHRVSERVYRCEILVEVPLGGPASAQTSTIRRAAIPAFRTLQASVDQSLAALITPVGGADPSARPRGDGSKDLSKTERTDLMTKSAPGDQVSVQ